MSKTSPWLIATCFGALLFACQEEANPVQVDFPFLAGHSDRYDERTIYNPELNVDLDPVVLPNNAFNQVFTTVHLEDQPNNYKDDITFVARIYSGPSRQAYESEIQVEWNEDWEVASLLVLDSIKRCSNPNDPFPMHLKVVEYSQHLDYNCQKPLDTVIRIESHVVAAHFAEGEAFQDWPMWEKRPELFYYDNTLRDERPRLIIANPYFHDYEPEHYLAFRREIEGDTIYAWLKVQYQAEQKSLVLLEKAVQAPNRD